MSARTLHRPYFNFPVRDVWPHRSAKMTVSYQSWYLLFKRCFRRLPVHVKTDSPISTSKLSGNTSKKS
uniref:Uncharacterized protein n=1 Tax=Strigamia maritima TaxID=126957 RepID=T1JHJ3_STRMM